MRTSSKTYAPIGLLGASLLLTLSSAVLAHDTLDMAFDDTAKPWQEIAVQLPAQPLPENLLPFYVSPTATHIYAVDAKSVSVGSDDVVRYTLVSNSAGGAQNVSYEGIRCQSKEMKSYAFGHANGNWTRSRRDQWQPIVGSGANRPQAALAHDYFCRVGLVAGTAPVMVENIRNKRVFSERDQL